MLTLEAVNHYNSISRGDTLNMQSAQTQNSNFREDFSEYVAELQLHMALQARNLVPNLTQTPDSRQKLLQETQANIEKLVSRQAFSN
jgi:uncharacterized membrane-anchored protein YhcB (DUF1043 family)